MFRIKTYNTLSRKGLDRFDPQSYLVAADCDDADAYLLRSQKLHDHCLPPSLKAIARAGAGVNNIPVERCTQAGVVVFNTPGANANAVKELVLAGLLLSARDIAGGMAWVQSLADMDDAEALSQRLEQGKQTFAGHELYGRTLGVVGLGAIGAMVAEMGLALGMRVLGFLIRPCLWRQPGGCQTRWKKWTACRRCWRARTMSPCMCLPLTRPAI